MTTYAKYHGGELLIVTDDLPNRLEPMTDDQRRFFGWYAVVVPPKPEPSDPLTKVVEGEVLLVEWLPTMVWGERDLTPEEIEANTAKANQSAIETNLSADLAGLQQILNATNAEINANPAVAIKAMARVLRRLVRYALRRFEGSE